MEDKVVTENICSGINSPVATMLHIEAITNNLAICWAIVGVSVCFLKTHLLIYPNHTQQDLAGGESFIMSMIFSLRKTDESRKCP